MDVTSLVKQMRKKEQVLLNNSQNSNQTWIRGTGNSASGYEHSLVNSNFMEACMAKDRRFSFPASRE